MKMNSKIVNKNTQYEILTPEGYVDFKGIIETKHDYFLKISLESGKFVECSGNHILFLFDMTEKTASELSVGDAIRTIDGVEMIIGIEKNFEDVYLYDVLGVDNVTSSFYTNGILSHNCVLTGGETNLISPKTLGDIPYIHPIRSNETLKIFEEPQPGHNYMMTVDTSRGKGVDASTFVIFDITSYPIKIVAHFSDSKIAPLLFPGVINNLGLYYNEASVLVEINDNGQQVADILFEEYEYPALLGCIVKGRIGQILTNFGTKAKGIKTSVATKRVGCSNLKAMIENYKIVVNSFDIIKELSNFVEDGQSFSAQNGNHDDLVMCLVIFGWATQQQFFKQYVEKGNRDIYVEELEYLDEMSMPMPIVDDGHEMF